MRDVANGELEPYPGELWSERVAAAGTEDARRELITEAARWRAQHLDDVPAMRRATFAISRLHALVGDRDKAVGEARQLMSLLQTSPDATEEEVSAVRAYLGSFGEAVPRGPIGARRARDWDRNGRREPVGVNAPRARSERAPVHPRGEPLREDAGDRRRDGLVEARRAASRDDFDAALGFIDGQRSAGAALLRAYIQATRAISSPDPAAALFALRIELGRAAGVQLGEVEDASDPLSQLLGSPIPAKRVARIRAIEEFAERHPDRLDELAAAALRHHLAAQGPGAPAPWLVGVVGGALSGGGGDLARAAIDELRAAGSLAVAAYDEWPFERLVRLRKRAEALGYAVSGMRRGVLARGEPDDRKIWTLRLSKDGVEGMLAVAPHASAAYPPGMADELGPRLRELCPRTLLLATGFGNAALRSAVAAVGGAIREHDGDDDAIIAELAELPAAPQVQADAGRGPATLAGAPVDLAAVLTAEEAPDVPTIVSVLRGFRRPDRAMRILQRLTLDDARSARVLSALTELSSGERTISEAVTFAILAAARGPACWALVSDAGAASALVGGGAEPVIGLAKSLLEGGWDVHRVLRGPTKRETSAHAALDTLSGAMTGLWRLLVRKDGRKGEVWFVGDLPPEGRAGVPLLLLEDWQRVVALPLDTDLLAWWRTLSAPEPVVWTGSEDAALLAGVEEFAARADEPAEGEGSGA